MSRCILQVGPGNFICVHVSLVPVLGVVGEQKTKPTQHSVATIRSLGLSPTMLACRSSEPLSKAVREKLVRKQHITFVRFAMHSADGSPRTLCHELLLFVRFCIVSIY